jgi:hypothetical protein
MSGRVPLLGVVLAAAVLLLIGLDRAWQGAISAGPIAGGSEAPAEDDPWAQLQSDAKPAESAADALRASARSAAERRAEEPALPGSRRARGRPSRATAAEKKAEEPAAECPLRVGREAIEKALAEPTELEFVETPLSDVVEFLQNKHRITIQFNKKALDDVGIGSDTPITKSLVGITLRSALRLMLQELDLTYIIDNEVLLITTPENANNRLFAEVYDVSDLVTCRDEKDEAWEDYGPLIEAITTIRPTAWSASGGPGTICAGTFGHAKVLIVSHSQEVHEEIAELLTKIRGVVTKTGEKSAPPRRNRPSADRGRGASSSRAGMGGMFIPAPAGPASPPRRGSGGMGGAGRGTGGRTAPPQGGADPFAPQE